LTSRKFVSNKYRYSFLLYPYALFRYHFFKILYVSLGTDTDAFTVRCIDFEFFHISLDANSLMSAGRYAMSKSKSAGENLSRAKVYS